MGALSRDDLLGQRSTRYLNVPVGESYVRIKSFSELERSQYEIACLSEKGKQTKRSLRDARALLLCRCMVDDDGHQLLTDDDVDRVHEMDAKITAVIFDAAVEHIGISNEDIEDLAKNCESGRED